MQTQGLAKLHELVLVTLDTESASLAAPQNPDVTSYAAARKKQLLAVARELRIFHEEACCLRKVRDLLRFRLFPILRWTRHAIEIHVIELEIEPSA